MLSASSKGKRLVRSTVHDLPECARATLCSSKVVVGYTKKHPIYTDVFGSHPPPGFTYAPHPSIAATSRFLAEAAWSRAQIIHLDAASGLRIVGDCPVVVECEGVPAPEFFADPRVRQILVESRWAGRNHLDHPKVSLLRPATPLRSSYPPKLNRGPVHVLAVGHGGMVKGFDAVFALYRELSRKQPVKLTIAGSLGHNFETYPEIRRDAPGFHALDELQSWVNSRKDPKLVLQPYRRSTLLRRIYPSADIYLHLGRMETFGFSVLEAMSYGLPVVATAINAIPEMVRHGENGYLIDSPLDINSPDWTASVAGQARRYVELLATSPALRQEMGWRALARVRTRFSIAYRQAYLSCTYSRILRGIVSSAGKDSGSGVW